jgi:predicted nucleotidyltransferase
MTRPAFAQHREQLVSRLEALVCDDERLLALWLQGSLADGTADDWSDVDAYVAVEDAAFDAVYAERLELVQRLAPLLIALEEPAWRSVHCLLAGPVKLDLFFVAGAKVGLSERPAVRVLVDKAGIAAELRTGWTPSREEVGERLERIFRGTFQGAAWPVRLVQRGQWTTLAATELQLVNDSLVTMMAVSVDWRLLFQNRLSVPRRLPAEQRALVESLGERVLQVMAAHDLRAALDTHLAIVEALYREGRRAYHALDMHYPLTEAAEDAIRTFYQKQWPATV